MNVRSWCERHQLSRNVIQFAGGASADHVTTNALIGGFRSRVIRPADAKQTAATTNSRKCLRSLARSARKSCAFLF
jgi:hypothetical protein